MFKKRAFQAFVKALHHVVLVYSQFYDSLQTVPKKQRDASLLSHTETRIFTKNKMTHQARLKMHPQTKLVP